MSSSNGYGSAGRGNAARRISDDEAQPLLNTNKPVKSISKHLNAELNRTWADLVLLMCYVVTGLLDSSSTLVWGAFVSMQTGEPIFINLEKADF